METKEQGRSRFMAWMLLFTIMWALFAEESQAQELHQSWSDSEDFEARYALKGHGSGRYWPGTIVTEYNDSGDTAGAVNYLGYANWIWAERTGTKIEYAGITQSLGFATSGKITTRWITCQQMTALRGSCSEDAVTSLWWYDSGVIAGAVIYINIQKWAKASTKRRQLIFNHELGHALGVDHGSSSKSVMWAYANGNYALRYDDVHRAEYQDNLCFVELTKEGDLYIPSAGGMSALLEHNGSLEWTLSEYESTGGTCSNVTIESDKVILRDVRTFGAGYNRVEIVPVSSNRWKLKFAE